jgi:hypothetical protein
LRSSSLLGLSRFALEAVHVFRHRLDSAALRRRVLAMAGLLDVG